MTYPLSSFLQNLCGFLCIAAERLSGPTTAAQLDLVDGRLMHLLAAADEAGTCLLAPRLCKQANQLLADVYSMAGQPPPLTSIPETAEAAAVSAAESNQGVTDLQALMPLEANLLIDSYLTQPSMQSLTTMNLTDPVVMQHTATAELFSEKYHWHCRLPLDPAYLAETARSASPEDKERQARSEQFQARHIRNYAISLQGNRYSPPTPQQQGRPQHARSSKGHGGGAKKQVESKKDVIKRENMAKAAQKLADAKRQQWLQLGKQWDRQTWSDSLCKEVDSILAKFAEVPSLQPDVLLYKLKRVMQNYKDLLSLQGKDSHPSDTLSSSHDPVIQAAVAAWQTCKAIASHKHMPKDHPAIAEAAHALRALGFTTAADAMDASRADSSKASKHKSSSHQRSARDSKLPLGVSEARFQLQHCGHLLHQEQPAGRDLRVQSFNPDLWQRKVS